MQTKTESILEAFLNTVSGFAVSWLATIYIFPLWGYQTTTRTAFEITCFYTAISIIRSYAWRRMFNRAVAKRITD